MTLFAIALGVHIIGVFVLVVVFLVSERAYSRIAAPSSAPEDRQTPSSPGERNATRLDVKLPVTKLGLAHLSAVATRVSRDLAHTGHAEATQGEGASPGRVMEAKSFALPGELNGSPRPSA